MSDRVSHQIMLTRVQIQKIIAELKSLIDTDVVDRVVLEVIDGKAVFMPLCSSFEHEESGLKTQG